MNTWNGEQEFSHEKVVFDSSGEIFKKTFDSCGRSVWATLDFNKGEPMWFHTESPYVMTSGKPSTGSPYLDLYSIWFDMVSFKNEEGHTNYCMHLFSNKKDDSDNIYYWWFTKRLHNTSTEFNILSLKNLSNIMKQKYDSSINLCNISYINPINYDYTLTNYENDLVSVLETRLDPFDHNYYTEEEFIEYYGSTLQWNFQSPEKILKREYISNILRYEYDFLNEKNINHLLDKLIDTF